MTGLTRGRLPARVYWVRRLMVLGIAMLLVVGIARLLGGSSDGSSGPDQAAHGGRHRLPGDHARPRRGRRPAAHPAARRAGTARRGSHRRPTSPPWRCRPGRARPTTSRSRRRCRSRSRAATSAGARPLDPDHPGLHLDAVAPDARPQDHLGRRPDLDQRPVRPRDPDAGPRAPEAAPTRVKLTWNARRSEPGCPRLTEWALPGTYHLHVAALAGQPQDADLPARRADTRRGHPDRPPAPAQTKTG